MIRDALEFITSAAVVVALAVALCAPGLVDRAAVAMGF